MPIAQSPATSAAPSTEPKMPKSSPEPNKPQKTQESQASQPQRSTFSQYRQYLNNRDKSAARGETYPIGPASGDDTAAGEFYAPAQAQASAQSQNPDNPPSPDQPDETNPYAQYYPNAKLEESQIAPWMYRPLPEEDVLEWTAPSRPFKQRNKKYFSTLGVIALLISLILGFAGQLVAVTVVIAVAFLTYTLSVVPPQEIKYKITTWGIRLEKNIYYWEELGRFWFDEKYGQKMLLVECARFPNRLTLMLGDQDEELIKAILREVLLHKKPDPTTYEKVSAWLQEKIPLDFE